MAAHDVIVRHLDDIAPVHCPCGISHRILRNADGIEAGLHVTDLSDAAAHWHRRTVEIYYVLEGAGQMEVDGERYAVTPGSVVYIPAQSVHRAIGNMRAIVFTVPPFDADDEYLSGPNEPREHQ